MGVYLYSIPKGSARKMVGGETFYRQQYKEKMPMSMLSPVQKRIDRIVNASFDYDELPLIVYAFESGQRVDKRTNRSSVFYDSGNYAEPYGYLLRRGSRFELIPIEVLDEITRDWTAFKTFQELINATGECYRPTIRVSENSALELLADVFDAVSEAEGKKVRAYRGG